MILASFRAMQLILPARIFLSHPDVPGRMIFNPLFVVVTTSKKIFDMPPVVKRKGSIVGSTVNIAVWLAYVWFGVPLQLPESGNEKEAGFGGLRSPSSSATSRILSGTHSGEAPICTVSINVIWLPSSEAAVISIFDWPSGQASAGVAKELPNVADEETPAFMVVPVAIDNIDEVEVISPRSDDDTICVSDELPMGLTAYDPVGGPKTAK